MSRSFRIIFLSSFALLFLFVAVFLTTGDGVDANPPSYWVTVDEREFEHIAAAGLKQGFEIVGISMDTGDAADDVARGAEALSAAEAGDADAGLTVDAVEDHELGWYAAQELPALVALET